MYEFLKYYQKNRRFSSETQKVLFTKNVLYGGAGVRKSYAKFIKQCNFSYWTNEGGRGGRDLPYKKPFVTHRRWVKLKQGSF